MSVPALIVSRAVPGDADGTYARLMAHAVGTGNDEPFAAMISTRATGGGALPAWLGLDPAAFRCLLRHHFPSFGAGSLPGVVGSCGSAVDATRGSVIAPENARAWHVVIACNGQVRATRFPSKRYRARLR